MKKFKKFAYIFLIATIIVLGFIIYSISANETKLDIREKTKSEISYYESKILYMLNNLNNIEFQNYRISVEDISDKSKKSSERSSGAGNGDDSSSGNSSSSGQSGESGNSGGSGGSGSSGSSGSSGGSNEESSSSGEDSGSSSENQDSAQDTKKYSLNVKGVLNNNGEINWEYIKNEAEMLQSSISTFSLDLYEISLNNNDILNFGKEYDNLLISLKNEDKETSLKELVSVYSYFPKFIKNCNADAQTEIIYSTKYSVLKAYAILDEEKWDEILGYIQEANDKFSKLLTDANIDNKNQYIVNKCYILLNELRNAVNVKDKEIFLIKYKNLLEDLNNL